MEELNLHEMFTRPAYGTDYARAKAAKICLRCGGFAEEYRDTSSRLECMVSALCRRCKAPSFNWSAKGGKVI